MVLGNFNTLYLLTKAESMVEINIYNSKTHPVNLITQKMVKDAKVGVFPPKWFNMTEMAYGLCHDTPLKAICRKVYDALNGGHSGELYEPMLTQMLRFIPTVAVRQMLHYAQSIESGHFRQWDYGKKKNLAIYGTPEPPDYPLEKIQVPVAIYYSAGDTLVYMKDVESICSVLPKCTRRYLLPNPKWNHGDFVFAIHLTKELSEPLRNYMETFNDND